MKRKYIGVGLIALLFSSLAMSSIVVLASGTEEVIRNEGNSIYTEAESIGDENFDPNIYIEKEEGNVYSPSSKNTIPYQEVPKISNSPANTGVVEGGNEKAINPLATKENKARGTVIENVNRRGEDITPKKTGDNQEVINQKDPNGNINSGNQSILEKKMTDEEKLDFRQFLSFQTKSGKTFHLIVDHEKNSENVQLLTEVGEQDLLNLIEGEKKPEKKENTETKSIEELQKEKEEQEKLEQERLKQEEKEKKGKSPLLLLIILAAVGGGGYYFKIYKPKQEGQYEEEEEDYEEGEYEDEYDD
ncbi:MAG TPA: DUF4366 domain-containing protein [Gallicola sp.]|nr:DUF4366 domain-containing protein [Gallicola sp.]